MGPEMEIQEPDESRPPKRVRLEAPLAPTEIFQEEIEDDGDWDDIYGDPANPEDASRPVNGADEISRSDAAASSGLPAENSHSQAQSSSANNAPGVSVPLRSTTEDVTNSGGSQEDTKADDIDGVPGEALDTGDDFVEESAPVTTTDGPSAQVLEETAEVETAPDAANHDHDTATLGNGTQQGSSLQAVEEEKTAGDVASESHQTKDATPQTSKEETLETKPKPKDDPEFLEAAATQKDNPGAEWQFDSSDAESSSDSSSDDSSDSDSDSGSEDAYEMLDPATAAKMLMSGDGDDEDGDKGKAKTGGDHQPRTANEVKEEVIPKPDVVVTPDMEITFLGTVDRNVENMALIKAVTPGEYQVLESGSVLCKEDREVIGAVAETFGRVQEPKYSVAFTNEEDLKATGVEVGTKIFYVNSHSTFVFTQPLKNLKGTDASNIHDEEVGEDEVEFSDDEKEAEYKRMKKQAKRGGRGGISRAAFMAGERMPSASDYDIGSRPYVNASDAPQQQYGGGMSYDDDEGQDDFYSPLKRPDNLSQMMANGGPPRQQAPGFDRGRGRGRGDNRGRGRGDRGRGRGGFDRGRGGRGGQAGRGNFAQSNPHRGNAHSFPDRHNNDHGEQRSYNLPPKPTYQSSSPQAPPQPVFNQAYQQAPAPQSYQFNGYTFQYGHQQQQPTPQSSPPTSYAPGYYPQQSNPGQIAPGAYVNPAFFQGGGQPQPHQPQWPQNQWQQQQTPYNTQASQYQPVQPSQGGPQAGTPNLADIMRQLGGQSR